MQSLRTCSYDHHWAIYHLLLDKLRHQLAGGDGQLANREVRRRPSNIAEQAMRKINRASTSEDCRRLLNSTVAPTASNSKLNASSRNCESPVGHAIDAAKLLSATNSEDALKILQQASSNVFTMSTEASKLMSTLQQPAVPQHPPSDMTPFRDYIGQGHNFSIAQGSMCQPHSLDCENRGSLSRFCSRYVYSFLLSIR